MSTERDQIGESRRRRPWRVAVLAAVAACGGCWEEIHFALPSETAERKPVPSEVSAAADSEQAADEQTPAPPPSTSDLFPSQAPEQPTPPAIDETGEALDAASILPTPLTPAPDSKTASEGDDAPPTVSPASPAEQRKAWQAVSQWSLGVAIHAKGLPNEPEAPILAEASAAATELGIEFPALPTPAPEENLEAAVIEGLRGELAVAVTNAYAGRFGEAAAAAADLAIRSHLLLLTYSPRNRDATLDAEGLRRAAEGSGLPPEIWTPLVTLVEERAPFLEVRQAVFDVHRSVEEHLAKAAESGHSKSP